MRNGIATTALLATIMVAGCHKGQQKTDTAPQRPSTAVRVIPAIPADVTGPKRQEMAQKLITDMAANPMVSPDAYQGEAFRRGVALTPELVAQKKASFDPKYGPPAPKAAAKAS